MESLVGGVWSSLGRSISMIPSPDRQKLQPERPCKATLDQEPPACRLLHTSEHRLATCVSRLQQHRQVPSCSFFCSISRHGVMLFLSFCLGSNEGPSRIPTRFLDLTATVSQSILGRHQQRCVRCLCKPPTSHRCADSSDDAEATSLLCSCATGGAVLCHGSSALYICCLVICCILLQSS